MDSSGDVVNLYIHVSIMSNSEFTTLLFVAMDEWMLQMLHLFPCIVCLLERSGRFFSWFLAEGICLCSLSSGPIGSGTGYTFWNKAGKTSLLLTFNFNTQFLLSFCPTPPHQIFVLFAATADVHIQLLLLACSNLPSPWQPASHFTFSAASFSWVLLFLIRWKPCIIAN